MLNFFEIPSKQIKELLKEKDEINDFNNHRGNAYVLEERKEESVRSSYE